MDQGPSKGLDDVSLMSHDRRLRGRPRLCSDCGLCDSLLRPRMAETCPFVRNRAEEIEERLHGRRRLPGDELRFGIDREQGVMRMRRPVARAQWTGMVTTLAARLLERGEVEAVILAGTNPGTRFEPRPVLARTPEEVRACAGNKPSLSPNLALLDAGRESGIRRLAVVGPGCQVQILRQAEPELGLERLDLIGLPCSDNVTYGDQQPFLSTISRSPQSVVHYELMQDTSLWLTHEDGRRERVDYIDFPLGPAPGHLPLRLPLLLRLPEHPVRHHHRLSGGAPGLAVGPGAHGARTRAPQPAAARSGDSADLRGRRPHAWHAALHPGAGPATRPSTLAGAPPDRLPPASAGTRGLEFARAIIEMKLLRNLTHVREKFPASEDRIVPYHVYETLKPYAEPYRQVFGREPGPPGP